MANPAGDSARTHRPGRIDAPRSKAIRSASRMPDAARPSPVIRCQKVAAGRRIRSSRGSSGGRASAAGLGKPVFSGTARSTRSVRVRGCDGVCVMGCDSVCDIGDSPGSGRRVNITRTDGEGNTESGGRVILCGKPPEAAPVRLKGRSSV